MGWWLWQTLRPSSFVLFCFLFFPQNTFWDHLHQSLENMY